MQKNRTVPQIFSFDIYDVSMRFQMQDQHNKVTEYNFKSCHTQQMIHVKEKVPKNYFDSAAGLLFCYLCLPYTVKKQMV